MTISSVFVVVVEADYEGINDLSVAYLTQSEAETAAQELQASQLHGWRTRVVEVPMGGKVHSLPMPSGPATFKMNGDMVTVRREGIEDTEQTVSLQKARNLWGQLAQSNLPSCPF